MNIEFLSVVAAFALVVFSGAQVWVVRRQRALSELQVINELRSQWEAVRLEWIGFLMMGGHFYLEPPPDAQERYPELLSDRFREYVEAVHFRKNSDWATMEETLSDEKLNLLRLELFSEDIFRLPLAVLATVAAYILRGRLRIGVAYEVFGAHLTRNSGSIRYVLDVAPSSTYYLRNYPGIRRRALVLIDMMWAEAARLRDLRSGEAEEAVRVKREHGTGDRNRRRLFDEARRLGGVRSALLLTWHLTHAELTQEPRPDWFTIQRLRLWIRGFKARKSRDDLYPWRDPWG